MDTTIQDVGEKMSSTPRTGGPFNFKALLDFNPVPKVVTADGKLPPGARLLWGVVQQHCMPDGRCYSSDADLAASLAVGERQLIRYMRVLESAGLLRTTPRPGKTPIRELLLESRFEGKVGVRADINVRGGRHKCQGGVTDPSVTYKEVKLLPKTSTKEGGGILNDPVPPTVDVRPRKRAEEWTEEDYIARGRACGFPEHVIQRDIEKMRARQAKPQAERMVKASELKPELEDIARRSRL